LSRTVCALLHRSVHTLYQVQAMHTFPTTTDALSSRQLVFRSVCVWSGQLALCAVLLQLLLRWQLLSSTSGCPTQHT
jgi:hypothetical protein